MINAKQMDEMAEQNIIRYLTLVEEFASIDHGVAWTPADGEREDNLRAEITMLRKELSMEPIRGFSCEE